MSRRLPNSSREAAARESPARKCRLRVRNLGSPGGTAQSFRPLSAPGSVGANFCGLSIQLFRLLRDPGQVSDYEVVISFSAGMDSGIGRDETISKRYALI